jgi:hypothetical protein
MMKTYDQLHCLPYMLPTQESNQSTLS